MAPSLGYFTLWLSLCFAILQFIISFKKDTSSILKFHKIAAIGLLLSPFFSFISLDELEQHKPCEAPTTIEKIFLIAAQVSTPTTSFDVNTW